MQGVNVLSLFSNNIANNPYGVFAYYFIIAG
jgi:hypothetical protein